MLIDDNCILHCANLDMTFFSRKESHDKWPAYFLDMNQIDILDNLGRPVAGRQFSRRTGEWKQLFCRSVFGWVGS